MRKYIKKQILGIMNSLFNANQLLKKLIIKNNRDKIDILLQDMQAAAIEAGEAIEKSQGEGTEAVHLLEELCELIWETSQSPMNEKSRLCREMHRKLGMIQGQIKEFSERSEVVFLPYKASMWDSLESVWMAADEDENCDAYVIPIPYYDKNPDGSFAGMHYEGDQYPDYVPITRYDAYDFEERHPEVIYIHNPYDEWNHVTSVHPFFYSKNLKKYTDKLVYIPYFVSTSMIPEAYCLQTGILYADQIITQSDAIKNDYIKCCKKVFGDEFPSCKIIAGGSPKLDKVIGITKSGCQIPLCWQEKIKDKKVILYNTHLNILLKYGEAAIEKIKSVFDFCALRDEMVLLWRPHPLYKATLKAMRPDLYEQYCTLEQRFITEELGIYDDNADMYPAIYAADAYYGDSSSVITVFGITGKPICIQNVEVTDYELKGQRFEGVCFDGEKMYFPNMDYNVLAAFDYTNNCVEKLGEFPQIDNKQGRITQNIGLWNKKLWMLPFDGKRIYSYNLETEQWETYPLPEEWPEECRHIIFAGIQIENYYYGFCNSRYGVMKLNMDTGEVDYSRDNFDKYKQMITPGKSNSVCRQDCCVVEGKIYAACLAGNLIMEYEISSERIELYSVGNSKNSYVTICYDGSYFWLTELSGKIIKWNRQTGDVWEDSIVIRDFEVSGSYAFSSSLYLDGYVWLFAHSANMNIRINVRTNIFEKIYQFEENQRTSFPAKVVKSWLKDGRVGFVDSRKYSIIQIDSSTLVQKEIRIPYFTDYIYQLWEPESPAGYRDFLQRENSTICKNLGGLTEYLVSSNSTYSEKQRKCFLEFTKYPEGNAGEIIYRKTVLQ